MTFLLLRYFLRLLEQEQEKSERLLLNVLPREIAAILKENNQRIADLYDVVGVLFADVAGGEQWRVPIPRRRGDRDWLGLIRCSRSTCLELARVEAGVFLWNSRIRR